MKTEVLKSELIIKDTILNKLDNKLLSQDEIDECLDIISAINDEQEVFNLTTNTGEFLLYVKGDVIKNVKNKFKN